MGSLLTREQNVRIEEMDGCGGNSYCYPPRNGSYFASHFIMGGERFDTCQPECYLFGENSELNLLGSRATPFPYSAPLAHEPTRTLRALINMRKESLRFVRTNQKPMESLNDKNETHCYKQFQYNIEFIFDTDVKCSVVIHYFCSEEVTQNGMIYTPKDRTKSSETYYYKKGCNQQFTQSCHIFDPSVYSDEELQYRSIDERGDFDSSALFPVVIHIEAQEGDEPRQSHSLFAIVERNHENTYSLKPLKQKLFVDGLSYLLQEIYGIENKNAISNKSDNYASGDEEMEDNSSECVICMSDTRDTLILPCRHLCLCNGCADSLRYQANNCPICRSPFRALLQLRAVRKTIINCTTSPNVTHNHQLMPSNSSTDLVDIPPGYEAISLIEALNGPTIQSHSRVTYKIAPEITESPVNTKKFHKNDHRFKKINSSNNGCDASSDSMCAIMSSPVSCVRLTASPSTPEVIVSGIPLSPNKEIADSVDISLSNVKNCDPNDHEIWNVPLVSNTKTDDNDNGSASSTSSATTDNIALQERVRLLSNDKDDEIDYLISEEYKNSDESGRHSYRVSTSPQLNKESPGNSSPLSIGISSTSYAIKSLRDGLEEQIEMDSDLVSIATNSSANNLSGIQEEDDRSDYFASNDVMHNSYLKFENELHNYNTLLVDHAIDSSLDSPQIGSRNVRCVKQDADSKVKQSIGKIALAETEILDDFDSSPSDV